jgi:hypothetical protein
MAKKNTRATCQIIRDEDNQEAVKKRQSKNNDLCRNDVRQSTRSTDGL